jgi:hypothetical protein
MGASDQHRFVEAARNARTDGGVETAANMLSGLAMLLLEHECCRHPGA